LNSKNNFRLLRRPPIELITVKEASQILSLAEKTIHNQGAGTNRLQRKRFGRAVRLIKSEVEAMRDENLTTPQRFGQND
jgi:predicted DNA-binding transcriptional regulator AlpA